MCVFCLSATDVLADGVCADPLANWGEGTSVHIANPYLHMANLNAFKGASSAKSKIFSVLA